MRKRRGHGIPVMPNSPDTVDLDQFEADAQPYRRKLIARGDLLPAEETKERWSVIAERCGRQIGDPLTVSIEGRDYVPAFYFSSDNNPVEIIEVDSILDSLSGWSRWHFFTSKNASLSGRTPLEALRDGAIERVRRAARAFVER